MTLLKVRAEERGGPSAPAQPKPALAGRIQFCRCTRLFVRVCATTAFVFALLTANLVVSQSLSRDSAAPAIVSSPSPSGDDAVLAPSAEGGAVAATRAVPSVAAGGEVTPFVPHTDAHRASAATAAHSLDEGSAPLARSSSANAVTSTTAQLLTTRVSGESHAASRLGACRWSLPSPAPSQLPLIIGNRTQMRDVFMARNGGGRKRRDEEGPDRDGGTRKRGAARHGDDGSLALFCCYTNQHSVGPPPFFVPFWTANRPPPSHGNSLLNAQGLRQARDDGDGGLIPNNETVPAAAMFMAAMGVDEAVCTAAVMAACYSSPTSGASLPSLSPSSSAAHAVTDGGSAGGAHSSALPVTPPLRFVAPLGEAHEVEATNAYIANSKRRYRSPPAAEIYPWYGRGYVDEATRLLLAINSGPTFEASAAAQSAQSAQSDSPLSDRRRYARPEEADALAAVGSIWHYLSTHFRNSNITAIAEVDALEESEVKRASNAAARGRQPAPPAPEEASSLFYSVTAGVRSSPLWCLLSVVYTANCRYLDEGFDDCVARHEQASEGDVTLERALSSKCRRGLWWQAYKEQYLSAAAARSSMNRAHAWGQPRSTLPVKRPLLNMGLVHEAEVCSKDRMPLSPFIPAANRTIPPYGAPRHCRSGGLQYALHLATPAVNVDTVLLPKLWDIMPLAIGRAQPGGGGLMMGGGGGGGRAAAQKLRILTHDDEDTLRALYKMSYFCMTHARGGWDCGRNTEMMSAGCIPMFYDIHAAGPFMFPHYPKRFLMDVVKMPIFRHLGYASGGVGDSTRFGPSLSLVPPREYPIEVPSGSAATSERTWFHFLGEPYRFYHNTKNTTRISSNAPSRASLSASSSRSRANTKRNTKNDGSTTDISPLLDLEWYWRSSRQIVEFARRYLTSEAAVAYVLHTMTGSTPMAGGVPCSPAAPTTESAAGGDDASHVGPPSPLSHQQRLRLADHIRHVLVFALPQWDNLQQVVLTGLDGLGIQYTVVQPNDRAAYYCVEDGDSSEAATGGGDDERTHASSAVQSRSSSSGSGIGHLTVMNSSALLCAAAPRRSRASRVHGGGAPLANRIRGKRSVKGGHRVATSFEDVRPQLRAGAFHAAIWTHYSGNYFPFDVLEEVQRHVGGHGRVAVIDGRDTAGPDAPIGSQMLAREVFYFSRELRRALC